MNLHSSEFSISSLVVNIFKEVIERIPWEFSDKLSPWDEEFGINVVTTRRGLASDSDEQVKSSQSSVLSSRGSSAAQSSFQHAKEHEHLTGSKLHS
jgi:hypothetical protein